ncbi:hypothetical protein ACFYUD_22025 [Nocardia tengchongensis]|uniref:hypothetical protein n=1 Tax=Nocardia tengchongensis TaxID=2055889 RepID=UPI0036C5E2EE
MISPSFLARGSGTRLMNTRAIERSTDGWWTTMNSLPNKGHDNGRVSDPVAARIIAEGDADRFVSYFGLERKSDPGMVRVQVPAHPSYVFLLRAFVEILMLAADFTLDVVTDVCVALDEVAGELIDSAVRGAMVDCEFRCDAEGIVVRLGSVCETDSPLEEDGLARIALGTLTDSLRTTRVAFDTVLAGYPIVVRFSRSRLDIDDRSPG